jgi:hypothetical protein
MLRLQLRLQRRRNLHHNPRRSPTKFPSSKFVARTEEFELNEPPTRYNLGL